MAAKKSTGRKKTQKSDKADSSETQTFEQGYPSLLDSEISFGDTIINSMRKAARKAQRSLIAHNLRDLDGDYLPLPSFYWQWCIDNRGIQKRTLTELIGKDGSGKTTLLLWLAGAWMIHGVRPAFMCGEDKIPRNSWSSRCFSESPSIGDKLVPHISFFRARTLDELLYLVKSFIERVRDPEDPSHVPIEIPLAIIVDLLNKPATSSEAGSMNSDLNYGGKKKKSDKTDESDLAEKGHTWDRAKAFHDLIRRVNMTIGNQNITYLMSEHQNEDAAGKVKTNPFASEATNALKHRTKPGGQATNQTAALQMVMHDDGWVYCEGSAIARRIVMKPFKNSYGTTRRICKFAIVEKEFFRDREGFQTCPIDWFLTTVEWFASEGIMGARRMSTSTATAPVYTIEELGLKSVNIVEAADALRALPDSYWEELGVKLKISGYESPLAAGLDLAKDVISNVTNSKDKDKN